MAIGELQLVVLQLFVRLADCPNSGRSAYRTISTLLSTTDNVQVGCVTVPAAFDVTDPIDSAVSNTAAPMNSASFHRSRP